MTWPVPLFLYYELVKGESPCCCHLGVEAVRRGGLLKHCSTHVLWIVTAVRLLLFRSFIPCRLLPKFLHPSLEELAADPLPKKMQESMVRYLCCMMHVRVLFNLAWKLVGKAQVLSGAPPARKESPVREEGPCLGLQPTWHRDRGAAWRVWLLLEPLRGWWLCLPRALSGSSVDGGCLAAPGKQGHSTPPPAGSKRQASVDQSELLRETFRHACSCCAPSSPSTLSCLSLKLRSRTHVQGWPLYIQGWPLHSLL